MKKIKMLFVFACIVFINQFQPQHLNAQNRVLSDMGIEKISIQLSGVVLNPDGNPVKDAVVFLKEYPPMCAVTDGDGKYQISGLAPKSNYSLWTSWAGCKTTKIDLQKLVNDKLDIHLQAQDKYFTKLEVGGAYRVVEIRAKDFKYKQDPLSKEMQECIKIYDDFRATKGKIIIDKILKDKTLDEYEEQYKYLLIGELGAYGWYGEGRGQYGYILGKRPEFAKEYNYYRDILEQTEKLLIEKGWTGGSLFSDDEFELLRSYIAIKGGTTPRRYYPNPKKDLAEYDKIGEKIPNFQLIPFDEIIKRSGFSVYPSLSATELFRVEGLGSLFMHLGYWNKDENDKFYFKSRKEVAKENPKQTYPFVNIKDYYDEKPVMVNNFNLEERAVVDWPILWKHLHHVYGEQINFIHLDRYSPWVGDIRIDDRAYFGNSKNESPYNGLVSRYGEITWTVERQARKLMQCYMERPYLPANDICISAWGYSALAHLNKNKNISLIDRNGIIATSSPWYHLGVGSGGPGGIVWKIGQTYNSPFNRWDVPVSYIATMEKDVRAVLKNDGYYDKDVNQSFVMADMPTRVLWGDEDANPPFKIISINKNKNEITTILDYKEASGKYIFKFDEITRFVERSENEEIINIVNDSALKVGMAIFPDFEVDEKLDKRPLGGDYNAIKDIYKPFDISKYKNKTLKAVRVLNYRPAWTDRLMFEKIMVLSGTITKIDGREIIVDFPRPNEDNSPGLRFWNKYQDIADPELFEFEPAAVHTVPIMQRWANDENEIIKYSFYIDDAVRIVKNGEANMKWSSLETGDKVTVCYQIWYEKQYSGNVTIYPELLFASCPIE